jgi:divalent metal cation (Fe/Co/Zn/Cd) transporter
MDVHHGWFSDNKEWIEYIVAVVVLWLLAMSAVSVFDFEICWLIDQLDQNQPRAARRLNLANNRFASSCDNLRRSSPAALATCDQARGLR